MVWSSSDLSTILKSILAESLTNVSSTNPNTPSRHVKKEGWTEVFGIPESSTSTSNANAANNVQIIQYRTDWASQLILRMRHIPHTVMNTPYLSNHTTGAYPQYRNLSEQTIIGSTGILPHFVEKYLDMGSSRSDTDTFDIQCVSSVVQELNLILKALRYGDNDAWENIYRHQCIQASLHHQNNRAEASSANARNGTGTGTYTENSSSSFHVHPHASFQAWAERSVNLKESRVGAGNYLRHKHAFLWDKSTKDLNKDVAIKMATVRYKTLDAKMMTMRRKLKSNGDAASDGAGAGYAGTLTSADVLLFAHLAEALCDLNLVSVLAECNNLIAFFQNVYEKYFGKGYAPAYQNEKKSENENENSIDVSWIKTNNTQNALNQFNRLPLNEFQVIQKISKVTGEGGSGYQDAIKIMQSVAMHCRDLQEVLADVALQKKKQDVIFASESNPQKKKVGWMFHILRMGGELDMKKKKNIGGKDRDGNEDGDNEGDEEEEEDANADARTKEYNRRMRQFIREQKKNDELWISGAVCLAMIGLVASVNLSES